MGKASIGIDPGARYTGVVIINNKEVEFASTIVRDNDEDSDIYAIRVSSLVRDILAAVTHENIVIGVEGISDPKGFKGGKRAAINPKDIIKTGITFGALVATLPYYVIVRPGNNGSLLAEWYPEVLKGRRPKTLPGDSTGAGTRKHEQSAFDVAIKALEISRTINGGR